MIRACIVEDDEDWLAEIELWGFRNGHSVVAFSRGDEAFNIIPTLNGFFDVIVLDQTLPGKSGVEVMRAIRSSGANTPVIFCTSDDSMTVMSEAFGAGADAYLLKPVSAIVFWMQLHAIVRRSAMVTSGSHGQPNPYKRISHIPSENAFFIDGDRIDLPPLQSRMLNIFMLKGGALVQNGDLMRSTKIESQNALAIHVCKLRKVLAPFKITIRSVYSEGYRMCQDERTTPRSDAGCEEIAS